MKLNINKIFFNNEIRIRQFVGIRRGYEKMSSNKRFKCSPTWRNCVDITLFSEPDIGYQITSIATEALSGDKRNLLKKFRLL